MLTVLWAVISLLLVLAGLAGVILPFIPGGVPVAWLGLFVFAIGTRFERISVAAVVVFFIVMVLTLVFDWVAPMLGAGKYKASRWGILGAMIGSFLGFFIMGLWGIILGPFLGAFIGELLGGRRHYQALKIGLGTLIGTVLGGLVKVVVILIMLVYLIASWF